MYLFFAKHFPQCICLTLFVIIFRVFIFLFGVCVRGANKSRRVALEHMTKHVETIFADWESIYKTTKKLATKILFCVLF